MIIHGKPTEDEAAAALAAIACFLEESDGQLADSPPDLWQWHASASLVSQGLAPVRMPYRPAWNKVERLQRAGRGVKGITGL